MEFVEIWDPSGSGSFVPIFGTSSFGYYAVDTGVLLFAVNWVGDVGDRGQSLLRSCIESRFPLRIRYRSVSYNAKIQMATGVDTARGLISAVDVHVEA